MEMKDLREWRLGKRRMDGAMIGRARGWRRRGEPERGGTRRWDWVEDSRNVICLCFNRQIKIQRVRKAGDVAKLGAREPGARLRDGGTSGQGGCVGWQGCLAAIWIDHVIKGQLRPTRDPLQLVPRPNVQPMVLRWSVAVAS
jgi:hypothetical protein